MKALTLTEPWATLMALQEKRVETRSWKLPDCMVGQNAVIHSAKGYPRWAKETCLQEPFYSALRPSGKYVEPELHTGSGLCVVKFIGCRYTQDVRAQLSAKEVLFGDYSDGRFAWFTEFVELWETPTPKTGHLGFWEWQVTASLTSHLSDEGAAAKGEKP